MLQNLIWYIVPLFFICAIHIKKNTDHLRTYDFLYEQNKKIIMLKPCDITADQSYFIQKQETTLNIALKNRLMLSLEITTREYH